MTQVATLVFGVGILVFFALDLEQRANTSRALWLPILWLSIATSRPLSQWLGNEPTGSADLYLDGSPLDRNVWMGLLVIAVIILVRRRQRVAVLLRANAPLVFFLVYCVASTLWSDYPDVAFKRWIKAVGYLSMVVIVITDQHSLEAMKRLLARLGALLVSLSVLLIKYYPALGRTYHEGDWAPVAQGVTTDKNGLGAVCFVFGLGCVWRLTNVFRSREHTGRMPTLTTQGTLLVMVVWLLWKANSMTSLACFVIGSGLLVATSFQAVIRRRATVHCLVVICLMMALSTLFLNIGGSVLQTMGRDPTLTGRSEIWGRVLAVAGNPLVGTGFESFWLGQRLRTLWSIYWWHPNEAHNGYLEIYLTLGWIGTGLLVTLMIVGYANVLRLLRSDPAIGRLKLAYFVSALVYNVTESAFRSIHLVWLFFVFAILAVPETRTVGKRNRVADRVNCAVAGGKSQFEVFVPTK